MVPVIEGDLLKSNCNVIIHQANCKKTMGAGIAKQIRRMYPEAYEVDQSDSRTPAERLGHYTYAFIPNKSLFVFNLYGQLDYKHIPFKVNTDYDAFESSLEHILSLFPQLGISHNVYHTKIGMPHGIGCGLANGNWDTIQSIIHKLSFRLEHDIFLYQL